ncbi:peptidylprolyl isomerase [Treponema sp.]
MVLKDMNIAKDRVVSIDYTLTNVSGEVLDSSSGTGPLSYLHGAENIISGLETALEGRVEGDAFKANVAAADAYGIRDENLVVNVPLDRFQGAGKVEEGMQFEAETAEGTRLVTVTKVANEMVTVDANHPLAGIDLTFDVKVVAIRAASAEELEHGHPHHEHSGGCGCGEGGCGDDCECGDDEESSGCGCGGCH